MTHGLTLLASQVEQCWGDLETWQDWLLIEMRTRYLSLCGMDVRLVEVHVSVYEVDACFDSGRTCMVAVPSVPPRITPNIHKVLYVRVRVDGYFEDGAVWSPLRTSCLGLVEQLGLLVICTQRGACKCYLNGAPLHEVLMEVAHGDFVVIYQSDSRPVLQRGRGYAENAGLNHARTPSSSSHCSSGPGGVVSTPMGAE